MKDNDKQKIKVPTSLPSGWELTTIESISTVIMGQSPPSSTYNDERKGLPFFQGKTEFGDLYPVPVKWCNDPNKIAKKDDVLISVRAPVGPTNLAPFECCIGRGLAAIRPAQDIPSKYMLYYLRGIESEIDSLGTGTTFKAISGGTLRQLPIALAPQNQRQLIVSEIEKQFSRLDEAIANLRRVKANLKRYKAAVLKAAVEGKLTEEWRKAHSDVEPASKLLKRILAERKKKWEEAEVAKMKAKGKKPQDDVWKKKYKEPPTPDTSDLPRLPKGWTWVALPQVAIFQNGRFFPSKEYSRQGVKLLRPGNLFADGTIKWSAENTRRMPDVWAKKFPEFIVGGNEIIMNLTAQSLKDEFLGRTCLTNPEDHCLLNQRLARITPLSGIDLRFLAWVLKAKRFRDYVDTLNTGSLIQHMFTSDLINFLFPLPPIKEQQEISDKIDSYLSIAEENEKAVVLGSNRSESLRQAILRKAFSGSLNGSINAI